VSSETILQAGVHDARSLGTSIASISGRMSEASAPPTDASDRRLRLRLVLGAASLGAGWLTTQLRAWNREIHETAGAAREPDRRRASRRLLGALVDLSGRRGAARRRLRALPPPRADLDAPEGERGGPLTRSARGLRRSATRMRRRARARLRHWEALGDAEAAESRELARLGLERTTARVLEWISGQPALRRMVAEQSRDLSRSALDEIRDATHDVDARAESAVRRVVEVLRRRRSHTE
jgi:hypothetical protein